MGQGPVAVSVNSATGRVYVLNKGDNSVSVLEGMAVTRTIPVGQAPTAIAVNPATNAIYVANSLDNSVTLIDGATGATATVAVSPNPTGLAVNAVSNQLYVSNGSTSVCVVDGSTGTASFVAASSAVGSIALNPLTDRVYGASPLGSVAAVLNGAAPAAKTDNITGGHPAGVAVDSVRHRGFGLSRGASSSDPSTVAVYDATDHFSFLTIDPEAAAIAVNPITGLVYVSHFASGKVTVLDVDAQTSASVPAGALANALAINPVTNEIYVANAGANSVTIIDGATNQTVEIGTGLEPSAIAIDPVTNKAYVANYDGNSVTVIDGKTRQTSTVGVGLRPYALAVNPLTNRIYVARDDATASALTVLDGGANTVSLLPVGTSAQRGVAVNPVTNKIYLALRDIQTVAAIDGETGAVTPVAVGMQPTGLAVDPGATASLSPMRGPITLSQSSMARPMPLSLCLWKCRPLPWLWIPRAARLTLPTPLISACGTSLAAFSAATASGTVVSASP